MGGGEERLLPKGGTTIGPQRVERIWPELHGNRSLPWHQGSVNISSSQTLKFPGTIWDLGVCCRSRLPGEEGEAATQSQCICLDSAAEPGPLLGSLGCCPEGFRPCPRATAAAAGKPAAGEAEPAGGAGGGVFPSKIPWGGLGGGQR